jgi:hypothetical protein
MALMIRTDIFNLSNFAPKLCEGLQNMYPYFLVNRVCSFHKSNNKPNIYLERAILVAVIFAPLQSVIHD